MDRIALITNLLLQMHTVHPAKLRARDLLIGVAEAGFKGQSEGTLTSVLVDMEDAKLVVRDHHKMDRSITLWGRTEEGRVVLRERGQIA